MLDYDTEAARYDHTRGGQPRARAAATAVHELIMQNLIMDPMIMDGWWVDCAGGTGIVTAELRELGHRVLVLDRSAGMLRHAVGRLPGQVVCADAAAAPVADGRSSAVTTIWLLHLIDDITGVVAEASRMLAPGGLYLTTVDKDASTGRPTDRDGEPVSDARSRVDAVCADHGLTPVAETSFVGHGQDGDPVYRLVAYRRS